MLLMNPNLVLRRIDVCSAKIACGACLRRIDCLQRMLAAAYPQTFFAVLHAFQSLFNLESDNLFFSFFHNSTGLTFSLNIGQSTIILLALNATPCICFAITE